MGHCQIVFTRYLDEGKPTCCRRCLDRQIAWNKQALYVMLIRLKAATIAQRCGEAELAWRYETWRKQSSKELLRIVRQYNYVAADAEEISDLYEDEYDAGWKYPLPLAEVQAQLRGLNEQANLSNAYLEHDFWRNRPSSNDGWVTLSDDDTNSEAETVIHGDQAMTDRDESEEDDGGNSAEEDGEMTDDDRVTDADVATARQLLAQYTNPPQDPVIVRSNGAHNGDDILGWPRQQSNNDGHLGSATAPTDTNLNPNPEALRNNDGIPSRRDSHDSLRSLFEDSEPTEQDTADDDAHPSQ
ncbi:hypothetical protein MMC22_006512 [Lobaria immixta]|nr:hypothetical protein [Lobaria immixta]